MEFVVVPGRVCGEILCPAGSHCIRMYGFIEPEFCYSKDLPLVNLTAYTKSPPTPLMISTVSSSTTRVMSHAEASAGITHLSLLLMMFILLAMLLLLITVVISLKNHIRPLPNTFDVVSGPSAAAAGPPAVELKEIVSKK